MIQTLLVIHVIIAAALVGVILLQKSEGGGLGGMGGGGAGAMSGLMSGRGQANLLTRTTAILAVCFFSTTLALAVLAKQNSDNAIVIKADPVGEDASAPVDAGDEVLAPVTDDAASDAAPAVPITDTAEEAAPAVPTTDVVEDPAPAEAMPVEDAPVVTPDDAAVTPEAPVDVPVAPIE